VLLRVVEFVLVLAALVFSDLLGGPEAACFELSLVGDDAGDHDLLVDAGLEVVVLGHDVVGDFDCVFLLECAQFERVHEFFAFLD